MSEKPEPILARVEEPKVSDLGSTDPARYPRPAEGAREVQAPEAPLRCMVCREHHGSQGAELRCLRAEVLMLRRVLASRVRLEGR